MVELRAIESAFPFYGTLTLDGQPYSHEVLRNRGVVVRSELLAQLGFFILRVLRSATRPLRLGGNSIAFTCRTLGSKFGIRTGACSGSFSRGSFGFSASPALGFEFPFFLSLRAEPCSLVRFGPGFCLAIGGSLSFGRQSLLILTF